eukprot:31303-Pelagococcus_subviridis.AAC.10
MTRPSTKRRFAVENCDRNRSFSGRSICELSSQATSGARARWKVLVFAGFHSLWHYEDSFAPSTPLARHRKMFFSASSMRSYLNLYPDLSTALGATFCPRSTTVAPSPSSAWMAKSGTGSHDGRPNAAPISVHISPILTGFGAVTFTGPDMDSFEIASMMIPTASSLWIHENHWLPSPIGPPAKT